MASYSIKAPNGRTYRIEGPDGATDEQVREQVLAQHPDAAGPDLAQRRQASADKLRAEIGTGGNGVMDVVAGVGKAMTDVGLGARQLAASVGLGDSEALAAEAAEKEKQDALLMSTPGGKIGKYGTDIASSFLPMGALTKVANARLLPNAVGLTGRLAKATAPAAAVGAAQGVLTPNEQYSPVSAAAEGAAWGAGGDLVGRGLGRVISPFRASASQGTQKWVDELSESGMLPKPTAVNMTDNEMVKQASDAMAKIPFFGADLNAAQAANRGAVTKYATGRAGLPMEDTHELYKIKDALNAEAQLFRKGPRISTGHMPADILPIHADAAASVATGMGSSGPMRRTGMALRDVTQTPTYSPNQLMDLRQKASDLAYGATGVERDQYKRLQKVYEDALRKAHGADKFDAWKSKWGAYEDIRRTVEKGGTDAAERLMPGPFQKDVANTATGAPGTHEGLVRAASARIPSPPGQENRALLTWLLLGAGAGGGSSLLSGQTDPGDVLTKALTGAAIVGAAGKGSGKLLGSPGGGRFIMGNAPGQSQASRDFIRKLLASGAIAGGTE
jgi:hypothetical protein